MNMPDTALPAMTSPRESEPEEMRLEFTGSGGAYFRIWIVNLLLSVLTLGIYSAWAKVRRERFFLNNTLLDGSPFEYHADPLNILKGRLLAASAIIVLSIAGELDPLLHLLASLAFLAGLPWMISRSLRFRAHYTSWRGLRFGFDGTAWQATRPWLLWPLASALSLGALLPFMIRSQWRYQYDHLRFGTAPFAIDARSGPIYRVVLLIGLAFSALFLVGAAAIGAVAYSALQAQAPDSEAWQSTFGMVALAVVAWAMLAGSLIVPWMQVRLSNLKASVLRLEPHRFLSDQRVRDYYLILLGNWILTLLSFGLYRPFAVTRVWRYRAEHFAALVLGDTGRFIAAQGAEAPVLGSEAADLMDVDLGF